jgi:hypothetical protein
MENFANFFGFFSFSDSFEAKMGVVIVTHNLSVSADKLTGFIPYA